MRARIHRGAEEVGGSSVELEARGERLILDVGLPLDSIAAETARPPAAAEAGDPSLRGVVVSHAHPDHYGLLEAVDDQVPVYMGEATARILRAAQFYASGVDVQPTSFLSDRETFDVGPFQVTPYLVDHSAFDSYALLVEAAGRCLFYTGDLRAHGRKAGTLSQLIDRAPSNVDALLLEGTTVGRPGGVNDHAPASEDEVEERCLAAFTATAGMALACYSPQNVDRLVSVYRAAIRSGRDLVMDLYAADVAAATGRETIPQAEWERVRVYVPQAQRVKVKDSGEFWRVNRRQGSRIPAEELARDPSRWVMTFRSSMAGELERSGCLEGAKALWLMWSGYLQGESGRKTRDLFTRLGVVLETVHASGHAHVADLKRLAGAIDAGRVVPIHTDAPERFGALFERVERHPDGEWWQV